MASKFQILGDEMAKSEARHAGGVAHRWRIRPSFVFGGDFFGAVAGYWSQVAGGRVRFSFKNRVHVSRMGGWMAKA